MSIASVPAPRFRASRFLPAALVAAGLAMGTAVAVQAIDDGNGVVRAPAQVTSNHAHPSFPLSADAAEHWANANPQPADFDPDTILRSGRR